MNFKLIGLALLMLSTSQSVLAMEKEEKNINALTTSVYYGQTEKINLLIRDRALINSKNDFGKSPLCCAILAVVRFLDHAESIKIVKLLIDAGADINQQPFYDTRAPEGTVTPLYYVMYQCCKSFDRNIREYSDRYRKLAEELIIAGADIDIKVPADMLTIRELDTQNEIPGWSSYGKHAPIILSAKNLKRLEGIKKDRQLALRTEKGLKLKKIERERLEIFLLGNEDKYNILSALATIKREIKEDD